MSRQSCGDPPATRVVSRNPPPATPRARPSPTPAAVLTNDAAARCGRWLTAATTSSWMPGSNRTTVAPSPFHNRSTESSAMESVRGVGVSTHCAPSNNAGEAAFTPDRSLPAMGWPPTNRSNSGSRRATTGAFTLPTSVTTVREPFTNGAMSRATASSAPIGTASTTTSAPGTPSASVATRSTMPPSIAWRLEARSESTPTTSSARRRCLAPHARDPPTRPTPTTVSRRSGAAGEMSELPSHGLRHLAQNVHHGRELRRRQRLFPVTKRLFGVGVDLDQQPVGTRGDRGSGHRRHEVPPPRGMAGVHHHRQMRQFLNQRHRGQVERVAHLRLEGPDAPLAQDHLVIAARHDVFRGQQKFFDRCGQPALEQHRLVLPADLAQQPEVLHIAGADLQDIRVLSDQLDIPRIHDLGDDRQSRGLLGLGQVLQALLGQPLKRV